MYSVLVCVDTAPMPADNQAEAITALPAGEENVHAIVTHVFEDNPEGASASQMQSVRKVIERFDQAGISHEIVESSGDPVEKLLEQAREYNVDAICVGGRQRSPAGKALFGSVAQRILLESDCPTIFVGQNTR